MRLIRIDHSSVLCCALSRRISDPKWFLWSNCSMPQFVEVLQASSNNSKSDIQALMYVATWWEATLVALTGICVGCSIHWILPITKSWASCWRSCDRSNFCSLKVINRCVAYLETSGLPNFGDSGRSNYNYRLSQLQRQKFRRIPW